MTGRTRPQRQSVHDRPAHRQHDRRYDHTPAGSPLNLLGIDFLADAGIRLSFVEWMLIGTPIAIVSLIFSCLSSPKYSNRPKFAPEKINEYITSLNIPSKFDFQEKYVTCVVLALLVLWILSSWFPVLNVTVVGTVGICHFSLSLASAS